MSTSDRLKYYTIDANKEQDKNAEDNLLMNLSISDVLINLSVTFNKVLNELLEWNTPIVDIFLSEDRLMYCGILLVIVSFALWIAAH